MNTLKIKFQIQLQCLLWIALLVFATIGCSAKQSLFESLDVLTEIPLNGSKTTQSTLNSACYSEIKSHQDDRIEQQYQQGTTLLPSNIAIVKQISYDAVGKTIQENYFFSIAKKTPPLYLILKRLKIALL